MGQLQRPAPELWMILRDRKRLAKLMVIQGVSSRELARAAGWKSHSYLNRLLRGEVTSLKTDPALRIAHHLGVGVDDLFLTRVSTVEGRSAPVSRRVAPRRETAAS